jgi:hypothetical protein
MASYSVDRAKHATLVASTVDTVTLGRDFNEVEILNRDGTAAIYFTVDGSTPTVGGDNALVIPAVIGSVTESTLDISGTNVVKLISAGTPSYSVTGT